MLKLKVLLSTFTIFISSLFAPLWADEKVELDIFGFSKSGQYYATMTTGLYGESGGIYAEIAIYDLKLKRLAFHKRFVNLKRDETQMNDLKAAATKEIAKDIARFGFTPSAYSLHSKRDSNAVALLPFTGDKVQKIEASGKTQEVILKLKPLKIKGCQSDYPTNALNLKTVENFVFDEVSVPPIRGCALSYHVETLFEQGAAKAYLIRFSRRAGSDIEQSFFVVGKL